MQLIESELSKHEYLAQMGERFESHFSFGQERFCGFTAGKFFYVIHHCGLEWDRKYNSPKNAAIGYVEESENGCEVLFMTFRGLLCPSQFLMTFLLCVIAGFFALWFANGLSYFLSSAFWLILLACIAICVPIYTLFESMTERSAEGSENLLSFIYDPKNHF